MPVFHHYERLYNKALNLNATYKFYHLKLITISNSLIMIKPILSFITVMKTDFYKSKFSK